MDQKTYIITSNNFKISIVVQFSLHKISSINILMYLLFINSLIHRVCCTYSVYNTIIFLL